MSPAGALKDRTNNTAKVNLNSALGVVTSDGTEPVTSDAPVVAPAPTTAASTSTSHKAQGKVSKKTVVNKPLPNLKNIKSKLFSGIASANPAGQKSQEKGRKSSKDKVEGKKHGVSRARNPSAASASSSKSRNVAGQSKEDQINRAASATNKDGCSSGRGKVPSPSPLGGGGGVVRKPSAGTATRVTPSSRTPAAAGAAASRGVPRDSRPQQQQVSRGGARAAAAAGPGAGAGAAGRSNKQEINRLEALCEERTKELGYVRLQLKQLVTGFDAMTVFGQYLTCQLNAFEAPALRHQIAAWRNHCQDLESAHAEDIARIKSDMEKMKANHSITMRELSVAHEEQKLEWQQKHAHLNEKHQLDIENNKLDHEVYCQHLEENHRRSMKELHLTHEEDKFKWDRKFQKLKEKCDEDMTQLNMKHESHCQQLVAEMNMMREEVGHAELQMKELRDTLLADSDKKVQMALAKFKHMPDEIDSLKAVLDIRSKETNDLRLRNMELTQENEDLHGLKVRVNMLEQKNEDLQAVVNCKNDEQRRVALFNITLKEQLEHENKEKSMLKMEKEELQYKLQTQFSSPDVKRRRERSVESLPSGRCSVVSVDEAQSHTQQQLQHYYIYTSVPHQSPILHHTDSVASSPESLPAPSPALQDHDQNIEVVNTSQHTSQ